MIRRPPRSTQSRSSAASDVYKRQDTRRAETGGTPSGVFWHRRAVRACQNTPLERWDCRTGAGQLADGLGVELADGVALAAPLADPPAATMAALSAPAVCQFPPKTLPLILTVGVALTPSFDACSVAAVTQSTNFPSANVAVTELGTPTPVSYTHLRAH